MISWLFEIDTLRLSTKDVTWSATEYSGLIIAGSFSGITMRWNIAGNGLIAPNEMTFDVSNPGGTSSIGDFEGEFCTVRLIEDDSNTRTWKFKIERAISYYGKITCYCVDFLQEHLVGDYPNTKAPKEIWPSSDAEDTDDYCVPVILGTAYIPVRSVNTATERYYILGEDITPLEYTVDEVMSPHAWPNSSTWAPPTYDMDTSVASGYQLLQPKIDERVTPPATGLWPSGDSFYDMLCKYSRADTALITNPADWVEYVLEDFGVASADIDATTFTAAGTAYGELFSGGGWWEKESRESVLSNLLAQTDSYLVQTDKVELHQFSATPVETITDVLLLSFSPSKITKSTNDSGRVHWPESVSKPSDVLNGQTIVPTHGGIGATENTPSSDILECRFLAGDSVSAQKAGILYFQKKYEQSQRINFSVTFSTLNKKATLAPGQVVTVNNSLYGGANNVIITDMTINPDMRVDFTGVVLNYLEDWGDLTPAAITVVEDTSTGFASTEDGTNTATIYLYKRASSTPAVTDITDPVTYTFSDGTIAESIGTWSREVPSGTDPIYIISAVASAKTETDTIARSEWSTPVVMAQNGEDGVDGTNGTDGTSGEDATNWSSTLTFTSDSVSQVSWAAGYIYHSGGTSTYVNSGSKTSMSGTTTWYIYFDGTSTLVATSTASDSVGAGKILVAVARYGATGATFQAFGGKGGMLIAADEIAANSITANKIDVSDLFSENITVSGNFVMSGESNTIRFGSISSSTYIYGNSNVAWVKGGTTINLQTAGTPSQALYLSTAGMTMSGSSFWAGTTGSILLSSSSYGSIDIASSGISVSSSNDIIFNTNDLYIDTSSGYVGINTTAPGYTLDVDGDIRCQTGHYFRGDGSLLTGLPSGSTYYAGNGLTLSTTTFSLTTPGTLSGSTTNSSSGNHTHAVTGLADAVAHTTLAHAPSNADYYYDWDLFVNGSAVKSVLSRQDVDFQQGTNVTLSYASDTITINATDTNTTYSAGTGLSLSGTTFSLATGSSPTFSTVTLYTKLIHNGDTDTYLGFDTDEISLYAGNVEMLNLKEASLNLATFGCTVGPTVDNALNLGGLAKEWKALYANAVYRNGTALDVYDDLYQLSQIQSKKQTNELGEKTSEEKVNSKGLPIIDPLTLPQEMTNYDDVVATLKQDNGDLISDTEIDAMINDHDEAGWMLKTNAGLLSDLTTGAVRQLDQDVISMFDLLSARITALETAQREGDIKT